MSDKTFFESSPILLVDGIEEEAKKISNEMNKAIAEENEQAEKELEDNIVFYSTCPRCQRLSSFSKAEINRMAQKEVSITSFKATNGRLIRCPDCNSSYVDFFSEPYYNDILTDVIKLLVVLGFIFCMIVIIGVFSYYFNHNYEKNAFEVKVTNVTESTIDLTDENGKARTFYLPDSLHNVYHKGDTIRVNTIYQKRAFLTDDIALERSKDCIYIYTPDGKVEVYDNNWAKYVGTSQDFITYTGGGVWNINGVEETYFTVTELRLRTKKGLF